MVINEKILVCRKNRGLSQEDVARLSGIHKNTLSNWERGVSYPNAEQVLQLCALYEVSPNYLLDYANEANEFSEMIKTMIKDGSFDFLLHAMAWDMEKRKDFNILVEILELAPQEVLRNMNAFLLSFGFANDDIGEIVSTVDDNQNKRRNCYAGR